MLDQSQTYADVGRHFDRMAPKYDAGCEKVGWRGPDLVFHALQDHINAQRLLNEQTLLDLGAGSGRLGHLFKRQNPATHVTAVDLSVEMLKIAKESGNADVTRQGDVTDLSWSKSAQFDFVTCAGVLDFIEDTEKFTAEVARVLKPGGLFGITYEPFGTSREGVKSYQHITHDLESQFRAAGAHLIEIQSASHIFTNFKTGLPVRNNVLIGQADPAPTEII